MQGYLSKIRQLQFGFEAFFIKQVSRRRNTHVDLLANLATSSGQGLPRVIVVKDLLTPSSQDQAMIGVHSVQVGLSWMDPLVSFLRNGILFEDKGKFEKIRRKVP